MITTPIADSIYTGADGSPELEIQAGLPNEAARIGECLINQDYYDGNNQKYIQMREAETPYDFNFRPKEVVHLVTQAIDILCEHLYDPGPTRHIDDDAINDLYGRILAKNHIDSLMHEIDVLATLNDVAAIQVAATGDSGDPIRLHVWGAEEIAVWTTDDEPVKPYAVCVISRFNGKTTFTLWYADHYDVYESEGWTPAKTNGGRTARLTRRDVNPYGVLPFIFVHYRAPVRQFWVHSIGTPLRQANQRIDQRLSDLAEGIKYYARPIPLATNVADDWRPLIQPGRFLQVPGRDAEYPEGAAPEPTLSYLQATMDSDMLWNDITNAINTQLQSMGVPRAAFRLDQDGIASGIAIVAEQAPLLMRARKRRRLYVRVETELSSVVMAVYGSFYGDAAASAYALDPAIAISWPEPRIPIPGPDRDAADNYEYQIGIKSRVQMAMERFGFSREQAIAHIRQVVEDEKEIDALGAPPDPNTAATDATGAAP